MSKWLVIPQWMSAQQALVTEILKKKGVTLETILWGIIDTAENAERSTPTWDVIEDYKTRLTAYKMLLDLTGVSSKSKSTERPPWLQNFLFDDDTIIDEWNATTTTKDWFTEADLNF